MIAAALSAELRKVAATAVVRSATVLIVVGIAALAAVMSLAADAGNEQLAAKLGPLSEESGWTLLIGATGMIAAPAMLLGFGVVLSWIIGREFADGTIYGLFAIPVSRSSTSVAKLLVFVLWATITAAALTVFSVVLGLVLGFGVPAGEDAAGIGRLLVVGILSGMLAIPCAIASTLGRSLLPGVATAIVLIAASQILVVAGTGAWLPFAAPALWVALPAEVSLVQLALVPVSAGVLGAVAVWTWSVLELDG